MSSGPTGPVDHDFLESILSGPEGVTGANKYLLDATLGWTGPTGPIGPIGPIGPVFENVENTGSTGPPPLTPEEVEAIDKAALSVLTAGSFDLTAWQAEGCPDLFVLHTIPLASVGSCCDGVSRNVAKHVEYILEQDLGPLLKTMAATMPGATFAWSTCGDSFRLHVTKAN
jgi:hypothetical protein